MTYAAAFGNTGFSTKGARPGIKPASSERELQVLNLLNHNGEVPRAKILTKVSQLPRPMPLTFYTVCRGHFFGLFLPPNFLLLIFWYLNPQMASGKPLFPIPSRKTVCQGVWSSFNCGVTKPSPQYLFLPPRPSGTVSAFVSKLVFQPHLIFFPQINFSPVRKPIWLCE